MDERVQRMERMSCEYISLADRIHNNPKNADELYDELRARLSRWHISVENAAWLASIDMGDMKNRWNLNESSTRQILACLGAKRWMIEVKRLHVDTKDMEDLTISGNPDLTRAIWENLLDNAIKFTYECGHIWISAHRGVSYADIVFKDDGRGISGTILPHVFDRYVQFCDNDLPEGLGLGLAVVKEAALVLRGDVFCSSAPETGTTVHVRLPLAKEQHG